MSEVLKRRMRCAVYTRKSTDEGLDQEYNSIDAQRDTGHAYIASQHAEGWIPVADDYDGPAFSGGHMERPALRRMMADLEAGKIDCLTRSGEIATRGDRQQLREPHGQSHYAGARHRGDHSGRRTVEPHHAVRSDGGPAGVMG